MGILNQLIQKFKPKAKPPKEEILLKKESGSKSPEDGGLNEEMVSESIDMEPKEDSGLPEVFEKNGEKEAEEKTEESAPGETKEE